MMKYPFLHQNIKKYTKLILKCVYLFILKHSIVYSEMYKNFILPCSHKKLINLSINKWLKLIIIYYLLF